MKCIRRHPAEAFRITEGNFLEVVSLVAEYKAKMMTENMSGGMKCMLLPMNGYIVLDSGTTEYLTEEEFTEMYKPLE